MRKVLITEYMLPLMAHKLQEMGYMPIVKSDISPDQLLLEIKDYEGIIISTRTKVDKP